MNPTITAPPAVSMPVLLPLKTFKRETLIKGQPRRMEFADIQEQTYAITPGPVTIISLEDEWCEDVKNPDLVIKALTDNCPLKPDIFSFWQRVPDTSLRYGFYSEPEALAVLNISTFDYWWNKQAKGTTRNLIRKSQKAGVEVRETVFNDDFVRGMTEIFNETPVRQGRHFWHYGKDFNTVKSQFSRFIYRESVIGAYLEGKLVGFAMMANAGQYGLLTQIISKLEHRDKAINNALIAKAVELCEKQRLPHLVYAFWNEGSLGDFKRHSGFQKMELPRYFVPLTLKGRLALKLGVHRGWHALLPAKLRVHLKKVRKFWHEFRHE